MRHYLKLLLLVPVSLLGFLCIGQTENATIHLKDGSIVSGQFIGKNNDGSIILKVECCNKVFSAKDIQTVDRMTEKGEPSLQHIETIKGAKIRYKDGATLQYFVQDGISVTMYFDTRHEYGTYYIASISIENFTGTTFNFDPADITVTLTDNNDDKEELYVYTSDEFSKRIKRKQRTALFFYTWGQNYLASRGAYSRSKSSSVYAGYSNTNVNISSYYGGNYGRISANINSASVGGIQTTTTTYDAGAAYAAQQTANGNVQNLENKQNIIRNELNNGYLKRNTIDNQDRVSGQMDIKFRKGKSIIIVVPVNGKNYQFDWQPSKK